LIYLLLGTGSAMTKLPVCDEAWYANPAINLSAGRPMATTVLESAGTPLRGLDRHTYWVMPLYIVSQAAVDEMFGPGLLRARLISVASGLLILIAWFVILRRLFESEYVALGVFRRRRLRKSVGSTGRSDMLCAGLGSAGSPRLGIRWRGLSLLLVSNA
jgi:hypothetical protein